MTGSLFPDLAPLELEPAEKLSPGRRLTLRQHTGVQHGVHPLAAYGARYDPAATFTGAQCGNCAHREPGGHREYPKCFYRPGDAGPYPRITFGPATDCRRWWPACRDWKPVA